MSENQSLKDSATSFLRMAASGNVHEAYSKFVGEGFRHHNPYFRGDAESLKSAMHENAIKNPGKTLEIQRAIQEDNLVAVHSRVRQHPDDVGISVVHIFRFEGSKIMELWDVGQAQPEQCVNEYGMF